MRKVRPKKRFCLDRIEKRFGQVTEYIYFQSMHKNDILKIKFDRTGTLRKLVSKLMNY